MQPVGESDLFRFADQWIRGRVRRREITPTTGRKNWDSIHQFARWWGDRPLARLGHRHVAAWLDHLHDTCAPSTVRFRFIHLRLFCRWLVTQDVIAGDPFADLRPPKIRYTQPRTITDTQFRELLDACPDLRARAIVWTMGGLGVRAVEVSRLQVEDWDYTGNLVLIHGKGDRDRWLPVPTPVRSAWDLYLGEHPAAQGPMIRSYRSRDALKPGTISHLVGVWMRTAGIKNRRFDGLSGHGLRHTFAQNLADRSGDIRDVRDALGHASLATTTVYMRRHMAARLAEHMEAAAGYDGDVA